MQFRGRAKISTAEDRLKELLKKAEGHTMDHWERRAQAISYAMAGKESWLLRLAMANLYDMRHPIE